MFRTSYGRYCSKAFAVLLLLSILQDSSVAGCPSITENSSCSCADGKFGKRIICSGITSELELDRVVRCSNRFHAEEFVISNSELRFINQDSFQGASYEALDIEGTTLTSLTDKKVAFVGLEDTLQQVKVKRCTYTSHWNWNQLKNMRKLKTIEVTESDIDYPLGLDSLTMRSLNRIYMSGNSDLTTFPKNAFVNMPELHHLMLTRNSIRSLVAGMFPRSLQKLDLSYNNLKTLPAGVFNNLPQLISVYLTGNKLHTLDKDVFVGVWAQITLLDFRSNPLVCDCRLKWITQMKTSPRILDVYCDSPTHLKDMSIKLVKPGELWC